MAQKILTKVKHIYFTPWNSADTGLDTTTGAKLELTDVIADTVAISQDDPETNTIDCETRDEPIIESTTLGKYTITMDSADIDLDILAKCLKFTKSGDNIAYAPTSYVESYACIEVEFQKGRLVMPRVLVTSKLDASSLKTNVAKGTISGTGYSCFVSTGSGQSAATFETPFFVQNNTGTDAVPAFAEYTVSKTNPASS